MQFSDPNANLYGDNAYGNAGMPYVGVQQRRRRNRGRGCLGCFATLLLIVLVGWLVSSLAGLPLVWGPTVVQVGPHPTLIIESQVYDQSVINKPLLHIYAGGQNGQIRIQPVRPLGIPFGLPELYQESSDHETVIYDYNLSGDQAGTFDITVPALTDLKVDTNSWNVLVEGVTGQMVLTSNSGSLTVNNCQFTGPSLLRDNNGAITFQGTLDPHGTTRFDDNGGPILVKLAQSANVHLDAITNAGSITSTLPQTRVQSSVSGFELHADMGTAPRATLTLSNNQGNITLNPQGGN